MPKAVRQAPGVSSGGEIAFMVDEQGVSVRRVETEEADPVIGTFLEFLKQDMRRHPQGIAALPDSLAERMAALSEQVAAGMDEVVEGPVAL